MQRLRPGTGLPEGKLRQTLVHLARDAHGYRTEPRWCRARRRSSARRSGSSSNRPNAAAMPSAVCSVRRQSPRSGLDTRPEVITTVPLAMASKAVWPNGFSRGGERRRRGGGQRGGHHRLASDPIRERSGEDHRNRQYAGRRGKRQARRGGGNRKGAGGAEASAAGRNRSSAKVAKLPRNSAKFTRQNRAPPRAVKDGSLADASNLEVVGVDVTRTQPFRLRGRKASQIPAGPG